MSAIYGTNLATDGLEILFDPNNPGSYPGSGDSIFDLSGNSRTGTLNGSPSFSSNYMNFDGSDDYIQFPTITLARSGSAFFIWVYVTDFSSFTSGKTVNSRILVRGEAGYNRVFALYNGGFGFETNLNSNPQDIASDTTPNHSVAGIGTGKWMNICMNFNSNTAKTYLDGVEVESFTVGDNLELRYIGRIQDPTNYPDYLKGRLGIFGIYNRALSVNEIVNNYDAFAARYT